MKCNILEFQYVLAFQSDCVSIHSINTRWNRSRLFKKATRRLSHEGHVGSGPGVCNTLHGCSTKRTGTRPSMRHCPCVTLRRPCFRTMAPRALAAEQEVSSVFSHQLALHVQSGASTCTPKRKKNTRLFSQIRNMNTVKMV